MRCNRCGAPTRVVATRKLGEGFILDRTRRCEGPRKHRFHTYEIDDTLGGTLLKYAQRRTRIQVLVRRAELAERNEKIIAVLRTGKKHAEVAALFNVSPSLVSTIARNAGIPSHQKKRVEQAWSLPLKTLMSMATART